MIIQGNEWGSKGMKNHLRNMWMFPYCNYQFIEKHENCKK